MPPSLPIFAPPPDQIDKVIDALLDPDHSFGSVAQEYNTTVEALTLWMTRPDIDQRFSGVESAIARRTRLVSANYLGAAIHALHDIITWYLLETSKVPIRPGDTRALEYRRRAHETTRRAASLLARLARFQPGGAGFPARLPLCPSSPPPPNPFGGGGRVIEAGGGTDDTIGLGSPMPRPAFSLNQLLSLLNSIQLPAPGLNGHHANAPPHANGAKDTAARESGAVTAVPGGHVDHHTSTQAPSHIVSPGGTSVPPVSSTSSAPTLSRNQLPSRRDTIEIPASDLNSHDPSPAGSDEPDIAPSTILATHPP